MKETELFFRGADGKDIFTYCWDDVKEPKAVVQIFHGMAEHAGRYRRFAEFLNLNGFVVYANDHRGHGKTAGTVDELGYLGEDGFNRIVEDEYILAGIIRRRQPGLPVAVLGHSFGSFIAQEYITRYGEKMAGVIIMGSALEKDPLNNIGKIVAAVQMKLSGGRKKSYALDKIAFKSFNSRIADHKSPFSWLSRDDAEVVKYEEDPFCGTVFTSNFFYHFSKGLSKLYKAEKLKAIPDKLPVLILSGGEDPVGKYGKSVRKLYEMYRKTGLENVQFRLYPGARHEILNEINRDEVFNDILDWLKSVV